MWQPTLPGSLRPDVPACVARRAVEGATALGDLETSGPLLLRFGCVAGPGGALLAFEAAPVVDSLWPAMPISRATVTSSAHS
jgi:hypothetical protein